MPICFETGANQDEITLERSAFETAAAWPRIVLVKQSVVHGMGDGLGMQAIRRATRVGCFFLLSLSVTMCAVAQAGGVLGKWTEPAGSTVSVEHCGKSVCVRLIGISKTAPATVDGLNPDTSLRNRPLCGVLIGTEFRLEDSDHAVNGKLYDPKTGKTYSGSMQRNGDKLALRGYVGVKLFGRTEVWSPAKADAPMCAR